MWWAVPGSMWAALSKETQVWIVIFHGEIGRNPAAVGEFPMGETCCFTCICHIKLMHLLTVGLQSWVFFFSNSRWALMVWQARAGLMTPSGMRTARCTMTPFRPLDFFLPALVGSCREEAAGLVSSWVMPCADDVRLFQYTTAFHWAITQMTPGSMQAVLCWVLGLKDVIKEMCRYTVKLYSQIMSKREKSFGWVVVHAFGPRMYG